MAFNFSVKVFPFNGQGKTRAFASVVVEDAFEVSGFKVIEGSKGLFVAAPNHKSNKVDENGKAVYFDDVRFLDAKAKEDDWHTPVQREIYDAILAKYNSASQSASRGSAAGANRDAGGQGGNNTRPAPPEPDTTQLW